MAGEARIRKLQCVKEREQMKDVLVNRYREKFGKEGEKHIDEVSVSTSRIQREVDRLVGSVPVTEMNLNRLERRLTSNARGVDPDTMTVCSISAYTTGTAGSNRQTVPRTKKSSSGSVRGASSTRDVGDEAYKSKTEDSVPLDWSTLDKLAWELQKEDAVANAKKRQELQNNFRRNLDEQVADVQKKQETVREDQLRFHEEQIGAYRQWQEQEAAKETSAREKAMQERHDRDAQMKDIRQRREEATLRRNREAMEMKEKIERDNEAENQLAEKRRQNLRSFAQQARDENMEIARKHSEQRRNKLKCDAVQIEEYHNLLDASRQQRSKAVQEKVQERQQLIDEVAREYTYDEKKREQEAVSRAAREREQKDRERMELDMKKSGRLQQMKLQTKEFLCQQIQDRQERRQAEREGKRQQGTLLEEDVQKYAETEKQLENARRMRNMEHRIELERQIAAKASIPSLNKDTMSVTEMKINRTLLELVKQRQEADHQGQSCAC